MSYGSRKRRNVQRLELVGNVQTGGATGRATTSDPSRRHTVRIKRVTFASSAKGGDDLSESS